MTKKMKTIFLMAVSVLCIFYSAPAFATLRVVTTTEDLAALTKEIGGDEVQVETLIRGYQDAHFIAAKPSYMFRLNRADLLIYQGMELEVGWLPLLIQGARNPDVMVGQRGHLNASSVINPIEIPQILDRSMGDIHPFGNPHYLLDPVNGIHVARLIADRLAQLVPDKRIFFQKGLENFTERLKSKILEWGRRMEFLKGLKVTTYHRSWSYLFKRFGIQYAALIEVVPGIPPTPKHLVRVVDAMKKENTKLIIQANYFESKSAKFLAKKTGSQILSLPVSVGGVDEVKTYIELFDYIVSHLERKLK
jgi:zinc/manganese transport system substrate-binding protein